MVGAVKFWMNLTLSSSDFLANDPLPKPNLTRSKFFQNVKGSFFKIIKIKAVN
jgi:hypothetical protein